MSFEQDKRMLKSIKDPIMTFQEFIDAVDQAANKMERSIITGNYIDSLNRAYKAEADLNDYFGNEPFWGNLTIQRQAYYAGFAEWFCRSFILPFPKWIYKDKYYLSLPMFAGNEKNGMMRLYLALESPMEFKNRNIFISRNALQRV